MRIGNNTISNGEEAHDAIMDKIEYGKEVFIEDTYEEVAIRIAPGEYYFSKRHGQDEYRIAHSAKLVCDAMTEANEITRDRYKNY